MIRKTKDVINMLFGVDSKPVGLTGLSLERFKVVDPANKAAVKSASSPFGNSEIGITEDDISALRKGKLLVYNDGECGTFISLKREAADE